MTSISSNAGMTMRVFSLWQPYASLLVLGFKINETRPYAVPSTVLKQRLGIASTKMIKPEQRALFADEEFQHYYRQTGLPEKLDDLPHGKLLGSVFVTDCELITDETLDLITEEETLYGDWKPGRYAWGCRDPEVLDVPVPVMGQQGIWTLNAAQVLPFRPVAQKR